MHWPHIAQDTVWNWTGTRWRSTETAGDAGMRVRRG